MSGSEEIASELQTPISKPSYSELTYLLSPLTKWQLFGSHLPGISKDIIETIEIDYKFNDRQKQALYSKWLDVHPAATWDDVMNALRKERENDLVFQIQQHISACQVSRKTTIELSSKDQVAVDLEQLHKTYVTLMSNIRKGFRIAIETGKCQLIDIATHIEESFEIKGLTKQTLIDEIFNEIQPHYYFLNVELIEEIVDVFLPGEDLKKQLEEYESKREEFEKSAQLQHVKTAIVDALLPKQGVTETTCEVVIVLAKNWKKKTLGHLRTLLNHLFSGKENLLNHIQIKEGSIVVTFLAPLLQSEFLMQVVAAKTMFLHHVEILEVYIAGQKIAAVAEEEGKNLQFECSLLKITECGDEYIETIQCILKLDININYKNAKGRTALMIASENGHEQVVQTLVSTGANVNIQDNNGYTALMLACNTNSYTIVNYLLQTGANPDIQRDDGDTAIIIACRNSHSDIVKLLLQVNADPLISTTNGDTAFTLSVYVNSIEIVEMLLDKQPESQKSSLVVTGFTTACRYGHSQLIISLLVHLLDYFTPEEFQLFILCAEGDYVSTASHAQYYNIDVNCTLVNGITPLMVASSCGHTETVQVLLQAGANVYSTDNDGYSPLVYAITGHKSLQVIEQLLKAGAQPNVFINDKNIVDKAREDGREDIFRLLYVSIQKEKEEEQHLQHSSISIIDAAKVGNTKLVEVLLKENADVNVQNEDNYTALMVASLNGHTQVAELLLNENADVNIQATNGMTALMLAVANGHTQIVELLLTESVDLNVQNENGLTALMLASLRGD